MAISKQHSKRKKLNLFVAASLLFFSGVLVSAVRAGSDSKSAQDFARVNPDAMDPEADRGAAGLARCLAEIRTRASILMVTAHPDDEDGGLLAYQTRGVGARGVLMTLNRGEGGQNAMSTDLYDALGLLRTQELLAADRYYGVDQYWGRVIDYGFSKTREEALQQWNYDRVLSDVVRVVRMTRPLVITSVFVGAPTDGHGNHQVAGQMAQEAFVAAGDPTRYPEQLREGLRPWTPLKVYCRVPNFQPTKDQTIYDYATDKYVPIRFFDYVNKTWMSGRPPVTAEIAEGMNAPAGLTYPQIGREGWGYQKSQNGGGTIPPPSFGLASYHRYGSRVAAPEKETWLYEGIDVSLLGIASLAKGDTAFLQKGLEEITHLAQQAYESYKPDNPTGIAPALADGLNAVRSLTKEVEASSLPEPGKGDVTFELRAKEKQFERALTFALGLSFEAAVAPDREPTGPFARFAGPTNTFTIAIPGQAFAVQTQLLNGGSESVNIEDIEVNPSDDKNWQVHAEGAPTAALAAHKDARRKFSIKAPDDATLTKPYFSRPNQEQPYYDLNDERYRNLSSAPYPLIATAKLMFQGQELELQRVVQTNQRVEGIGLLQNPLLMGPPISVAVAQAAGAVPLSATKFDFSCTLHTNVKGPASGVLRLHLPDGWQSTPAEYPFSFARDGENQTVTFQIVPHAVKLQSYDIKASAEFDGKTYEEGYRLVGYPGVRPYPYYRPALYKAVGTDVKTAPSLRVAFFPGTGDDVPRALDNLGVHPQILSGADIENANLSDYDAIVLGTRAYAVRPELRSANSRLLEYVKNGGVLVVQYNLQNFDRDYGPYPLTLGANPQKVVDEASSVKLLNPQNPVLTWPNRITEADFKGWEEERGHGFPQSWDSHYQPLVETHDPEQDPQSGGLLLARYGKGFYVYDAFALYRQLPAGVPGAYRILANLVSIGKNPEWK